MRTRPRQLEVVRVALAKAYVDNYKMNKGCSRCGFNEHPVALEFNHIEPSQKVKTVSQLVKKGVIKNIKAEIEKCHILCSNCHRIHTYANKHHMKLSESLDD
jgi:hypothetical protein